MLSTRARPRQRRRRAATQDEQTETQPRDMAPQEKDVVLAVHEDDRMQLKALVAKFKPTFTEKADKDLFMAIVKRVAKFVQEGEDRFVRLNDSTLDQYGLRAPDPVAEGGGGGGDANLASAGLASSAGLATESCGSSSHDIPVVDETLMRRLAEQSDKLDTGYSAIENCGSQVLPHGHTAALARRELGSCPSSGRGWRLWAARHSRGRCLTTGGGGEGSQPLPSRLQSRRFHSLWPSRHLGARSTCATSTRS